MNQKSCQYSSEKRPERLGKKPPKFHSVGLMFASLLFLVACNSGGGSPTPPPVTEPGNGGDPNPDTTSTGTFSLNTPDQVVTLVEGSNGLSVSVSVSRIDNHQEIITLALYGETAADAENLTASFDNPTLVGFASNSNLNINLDIASAPILQQQRRLLVRATDGEKTVDKFITVNVEPVSAPDIYLLVGQSNMQGSSLAGSKDVGVNGLDEPHPRIRQLNVTGNNFTSFANPSHFTNPGRNVGTPQFTIAEDPLHETSDPANAVKPGTQIGLGLSFAKAALQFTTQDIILVPAAWSGTGFCENNLDNLAWNAVEPSSNALGGTSLFDRAIVRANIAINESGGILRGILWHQGESDATSSSCANLYRSNLELLVRSLRSNIRQDRRGANARGPNANIPFILGTMSRGNDDRGEYVFIDAAKSEIYNVHRTITTGDNPLVNFGAFVNNDDLVPESWPCGESSCVHFGASAYREMGRRYYQKLREVNAR